MSDLHSHSQLSSDHQYDENVPPPSYVSRNQLDLGMNQQDQKISDLADYSSYQNKLQPDNHMFKSLQESLGAVGQDKSQLSADIQQFTDTTNLRKASLMECEINCEEVQEDEQDIRRKINQKLIKNKNYFMQFVAKGQKERHPSYFQLGSSQNQKAIQMIDKRSRSETPNKMSATEVLFRAHQKLQMRRKESPAKLLEKHQQRQKKAEELRAQIEISKKKWYEKIRIRQEIAKARWKELLAERKAKLQGRMEQAEERRETEIETLRNKAKQEIQKIDETNYIVKMTMNNMKLDLNMKMNETQERRNQIMEEHRKKQHERHLKEEAVVKRRQEQLKETENKIRTKQQKREEADARRIKMLEEKKKAAQEYQKRELVLQRKNDLGDRISDVMSFVNNSENIWEFLGNGSDWPELDGHSQEMIFALIQKDCFELEKMKLKKDAEVISKMIIVEDNGQIYAKKEYLPIVRRRKNQEHSASEDEEEELLEDDHEIFQSPDGKKHQTTPQKNKLVQVHSLQMEETKAPLVSHDNQDCYSEGDKDSIAEETSNPLIYSQNSAEKLEEFVLEHPAPQFTDEVQNYMLYSNRLKMSMKRNILKKNLSEDLTWADFLKNDCYNASSAVYPTFKSGYTRSMYSTPERKAEIPNEGADKEEQYNANSDSTSKRLQLYGKESATSLSSQVQNTNQQNSSSSNVSEKSRISSVVYPSKKKKNPINQNQIQTQVIDKTSGSFVSSKQKTSSNSNNSSTHSLQMQNTISSIIETPRDSNTGQRKSVQLYESDSGRKRQNARMHSSSVQESSQGIHNLTSIMNSSVVHQSTDPDEKFFETALNASFSHTGSQMSQLLTNSKPMMQMSKVIPKKLTANASKMLFPIAQQKLLLKRPGKEGQFGKCKLTIKIDDLSLQKQQIEMKTHSQVPFSTEQSIVNDIKAAQAQAANTLVQSLQIVTTKSESIEVQNQQLENTGRKSLQSTPSLNKRKESSDTNNSQSNLHQVSQTSNQASVAVNHTPPMNLEQAQKEPFGTPTQQSKLWQMHQKFWEKSQATLSTDQQQAISTIKKHTTGKMNSSHPSENSPSPTKDGKSKDDAALNTSTHNTSLHDNTQPPSQMNEQGYKELIIKYLLTDNVHQLKTEDTQKTIFLESEEANKLIDYLEQHELQLRYCRLCDLIIPDHCTNEAHVQMKSHKKTREELYIKEIEDIQFSFLSIHSSPGDIEKELLKEKEKALKRKVKRLKAQMIAQAVSHETASYCPGKEFTSSNKKRFQILCIDLEKQVIPIIKDYDALESTLKEILKILDMRKQSDLHLMRRLKFIPILIEICKRISVCHKNEFKHLGRVLEYAIKIINIFCGLRENRNYMLQTNRMSSLIELLNWCLNRPTQLFYGIAFMPQLFHILTLHMKHRAPYECQQMKEMFIEYLINSQITMKIKGKFQIINGPLDLSEMMGQVPLFLLKSATFLESLTNLLSIDSRSRPLYEKTQKIGEHVFFVLQNTELFGIIPMIVTILLTRNQPFKPSQKDQTDQALYKVLPQTILSLAITSIKIVNNVYRMDYRFAQQIMSDFEIQEQLYHLFNYILFYTVETSEKQEDSKELLHETLLLIGYFCLNNEKNQALLCKGENTLLQKLCNLPFPYFCDKKLKEILFPTLIQASYKNERSLAIMDQEISIEMLVDFIQLNLKEELPKIIEEECDYQSMSSVGHSAVERKSHRSPSISSTNSSQCSLQIDMINGNSPFLPLYMRFPKQLWKDAITFYSKVLY